MSSTSWIQSLLMYARRGIRDAGVACAVMPAKRSGMIPAGRPPPGHPYGATAMTQEHPRAAFGRGFNTRRLAAVVLPALTMLATPGPSCAEGGTTVDGAGIYAGAFAGLGRADNRIVDVDGFANWGNPGWTVDYGDTGFVGGALIGKRFKVAGTPLRVEIDAMVGGLSARTNRLDPPRLAADGVRPVGGDETAVSKFRWLTTARAGVERTFGRTTVFATAGLAAARSDQSVTDLDRSLDPDTGRPTPWRRDPDDSFRKGSTDVGWVIGIGLETLLSDSWTLRLDGSYLDFGRESHSVNRSADNRCCGPETPRRPAAYQVENKLGIVRLALIYRLGGP